MVARELATFAALLKRYRVAAGLTQEELAERASLSVRGISNLERGVRHLPQHATIELLAEALQLAGADRAAFVAAARGRSLRLVPGPRKDIPLPLPPTPLLGREVEAALLDQHLTAAKGPSGRPRVARFPAESVPVLLLAGEPGIGKSRLLQEAIRQAEAGGWTVLAGGCQRRGEQEPYAPLLEALALHLTTQPLAQARASVQGCAWLVRLLPELGELLPAPLPLGALPPDQERRLLFAAVGRYLANVVGPAGTLLVLDDLQWAGPDALELLASLARSSAELSVRVVGAYRDTEVGPQERLAVLLADLGHAGLARQHTLAPLAPQDAACLLDVLLEAAGPGLGTPALREHVLQRAGGVPFFLVSYVQGLRTGDGAGAVPWDVAQSVRQRVAALPEAAQALLRTAAVLGRVVPHALLSDVVAQPAEEVLDALEAAGRARLLAEEDDETYQFAHDLIREVIEADLGAARRALLHRRVAEALEREPGALPVEALAYHYARSDAQDKALVYLEQAGDQAWTQCANAAAESYYREVVDRLEELGRPLDAARAREKLGAVLRTATRYDEALAALERAAATYRAAGDLESLGRVTAQIGWIHADRGTPAEGLERLQPLLGPLEAHGPSHGLAALYAALATLFHFSGRYTEQLAAAERAAHLARVVGDDRILAEAEWSRGLALYMVGRCEEALRTLEAAIPVAETADDYYSLCQALYLAGNAFEDRGEFDASRLYAERALGIAERQGDWAQMAFMTTRRGMSAFYTGDWSEARRDYEQAVAMSREIGAFWARVYPLLDLGRLCLAEGAWEQASGYLAECERMVRSSGDLDALREVQSVVAERDLLAGHPEAARARLVPLLDRAGLQEEGVTFLLPRLAWAHLQLGEVRQAAEVGAQALARARHKNKRLLVDSLWVQAMITLRQERWEEAERSLEEGVALARRMPYPYAQARLLYVYGQMHAQRGEPGPARERLEAALAIFQRLGARKDAEHAEMALTALRQ